VAISKRVLTINIGSSGKNRGDIGEGVTINNGSFGKKISDVCHTGMKKWLVLSENVFNSKTPFPPY